MAIISQPLLGTTARQFPQRSVKFDWLVVLLAVRRWRLRVGSVWDVRNVNLVLG